MSQIFYKTVSELSDLMDSKELSSAEITKAFIERTKSVEDKISAFISYDEDSAMKAAEASDTRRARGEKLSELDGIPVGLKDVLAVKGQPLTCASRMLENFVSPYTGTSLKMLEDAGAVFWDASIWTSSQWGRRAKIAHLKRQKIHGILPAYPAEVAGARLRRLPQESARWRSAAIRVGRYASLHLYAESLE